MEASRDSEEEQEMMKEGKNLEVSNELN